MFELRAGKTDRRIWISDRYGVGSIGFVGFDLVMEVIVNKVLLGSFGVFWIPCIGRCGAQVTLLFKL